MNAAPRTISIAPTAPASVSMIALLRALLMSEAAIGLGLAVLLSVAAGRSGPADETALRFAAAGAFLFAIFAAVASRGARRHRARAWTMSAMLQLVLVIGTGAAVLVAEWHPAYLLAFALGALVMLVLSAGPVRRKLGQA